MDTVATLNRVIDETSRLVNNLSDDDLEKATPCQEWKVRDLLNHITGGATMFAVSAEQGSVPDEMVGQLMGGDNLGADFKGAWAHAAKQATAAFNEPGVLDKTVKLPFGEMPAGIALNIAVFDVTTHACDLAKATGQQVQDESIIDAALELGPHIISPDFRKPGIFDAEVEVGPDAPRADRLLAFAGRKV